MTATRTPAERGRRRNASTAAKRPTHPTPKKKDWRESFLVCLAETGNVRASAKAARIHRDTAYHARDADPDFAARWQRALEDAGDVLEGEAWRRAVKGTNKPIYQQGKKVGVVREYSDTLLIFLLKGIRPWRFRESAQSIPLDVTRLTDEQLRRIAAGEHPLAVFATTAAGDLRPGATATPDPAQRH